MELQIFTNDEFGQVRSLIIDDEPWFVGNDITTILKYKDKYSALRKNVDDEDKRVCPVGSTFGLQDTVVINESGLYSLVLKSKLPSAKAFKRWVTSEVLPQIRKTGGYIPIKQEDSELEIMSKAFLIAQRTLEQKEALIAQQNKIIEDKEQTITKQKPLVNFAAHVAKTDDLIDIGEMANLLCDNGIDIGKTRLFNWLKNNKYFFNKKGSKEGVVPYQKYISDGYFVVKESVFELDNGKKKTRLKTYVTGLGQIYLLNKIKDNYSN